MIFLIAGFLFVSYATGSVLPNNASHLAVRDEKGKEFINWTIRSNMAARRINIERPMDKNFI